MADGNRVFRAKATFFIDKVKVSAGDLVREGHGVLKDAEHLFEELHVNFEREDIKAAKAAKAAADVAAHEAEAKALADAKEAKDAAAKDVEADASKVVASDVAKAAS